MSTELNNKQRRAKPKKRQKSLKPVHDENLTGKVKQMVPFWLRVFVLVLAILLFKTIFQHDAEWQSDFMTNLTTEVIAISLGLWFLNKIEEKDNRAIVEMEINLTQKIQNLSQQLRCSRCSLQETTELKISASHNETETQPTRLFDENDDFP